MTGVRLFLTLSEVEDMHADQIEEFGGSMGIRDLGGLKSAIAQPEANVWRRIPSRRIIRDGCGVRVSHC